MRKLLFSPPFCLLPASPDFQLCLLTNNFFAAILAVAAQCPALSLAVVHLCDGPDVYSEMIAGVGVHGRLPILSANGGNLA